MNDAYHERVSLTSKNLDRVNSMRLTAHTVNFNNRHIVTVDSEHVVRVAGDRDQTETIARTQSMHNIVYSDEQPELKNLRGRVRLRLWLWLHTVFRLGR